MKIGPSRYSTGGNVTFARYANGQTAIIIYSDSGEREGTPTVNLEEITDIIPKSNQVWIKTWSGNEGFLEALIKAKVVESQSFAYQVNAFGSLAHLCDLTPEAIAEREAQEKNHG